MKKAQGLSLNTIIVAAIVLIVLIVLWAIFSGKMSEWTKDLRQQDKASKDKAQEVADLFTEGTPAGEPDQVPYPNCEPSDGSTLVTNAPCYCGNKQLCEDDSFTCRNGQCERE